MRAEGICVPATTCDRGIPLPTQPRNRDSDHITQRAPRDPLAASPFRGQPVVEFTREQLAAAGYQVPGAPKPKRTRRSPVHTGPRPALRRFDHDAAVTAYLEGEASTAIANRLGVTTASVLNAVRAAGHEVRIGRPATKRERTQSGPKVMPRKFDHQAAVTAYLAGATVLHLADEHGVSDNAIRRVIRDAGHQLRPVTAWDREAAVAEYVAGESSTVVAARHGVSDCTVREAVKAAGHPMHDASAHTRAHIDDNQIRTLYLDDMLTPPQIATRLRIGARTVRTSLDRQGVPRRDDRTSHSGGSNRLPDSVLRAAAELYATGLTRTQVADRLNIGVKSVDAGIRHVGDTPRPAAHIPGAQLHGTDGAAALKDLMAANDIHSRDVRAWACQTGRPCPDWGIPSRQLVEDYLLNTTPSTTDRKAATA